jgi:hypothetical protein
MATTTEYWLYTGVIQTESGEPYRNAKVTAFFEDGREKIIPIQEDGIIDINVEFGKLPLDFNINTDKAYTPTSPQSKLLRLDIIPKENEFQPLTLTSFVVSKVETTQVNGDTNLYNLGVIILIPPFQLQSKTLQDIEIINKTAPIKSVKELPKPQPATPSAQASKRVRKFTFNLSKRLPKYVLNLLAPFGVHLVQKALEGKRGQELTKWATSCPSPENLLVIINLRNELTTILNNANKVVTTTNDSINIFQTLLGALNAVLTVLKNIPYPTTGIPPLGLPPITVGVANTFSSNINKIQTNINKGQISLSTIQSLTAILAGVLTSILELLNALDGLIQKCAEEQNVPYNLINAELVAIQGQVETSYKGFNFAIKLENLENPKYPKRYAIAVNQVGITVLRSQSSFTANPQTLIDELKFIIDRDNLKAF